MTLLFNVNGRLTAIPGAYQESVENSNVRKSGVDDVGVVAIVGEGKGIYAPKVPREHISPNGLSKKLVGGDLNVAAKLVFEPSKDTANRGATRIITCKVNPATKATSILQSAASANLIDLESKIYGAKAGGISYQIADGSSGAFGKKMTIQKFGENDEVLDNMGFLAPAAIKYTGDATTAQLTINSTSLAVTLAGDETDGSTDLACPFATFETLEEVANYVNQQTGYEMQVFDPRPATFDPVDLDYVTGADILEESGTLTIANPTATTFTGTFTGLDDNDVVKIGDEYLFVVDAATPTILRGYAGTLPVAHTAVAATSFYALTGVNKAIIDELKNKSARLSGSRNAANAVGVPDNVAAKTFLTGGVNGTSSDADWLAALEALKPYKVDSVVLLSDDPVHHQYLNDHINYRWGIGNSEAHGFTGHEAGLIQSVAAARTRAVNNTDVLFTFQGIKITEDGVEKEYPPYMKAALMAGLAAGSGVGEPIYQRSLNITGLTQAASIDVQNPDVQTSLIVDRMLVSALRNARFELIRDITSYSNDDDVRNIQLAARTSARFVLYKVRESTRQQFQPGGVGPGDAASIKTYVESVLQDIEKEDKVILPGNILVDGAVVAKPAWFDVSVTQDGNVTRVFYSCVLKVGRDFIGFNTIFDVFQDAA